jgi:hypothetical protein
MTENRPNISVYPDIITIERAHEIVNDFISSIESVDISTIPVRCRVRANRDYVEIPKNTLDISADVEIAIRYLRDSHGAIGPLQKPVIDEHIGIYYCNVDEYQRLQLKRVFLKARDADLDYSINIVKNSSTLQLNVSRNTRRMWGATPRTFRYQRGDYRDIIVSIPQE